MAYEQITYEVANFVATIKLNRPDKLNAWTQRMEEEIGAAVREASADELVRVIILTGAGKGFCAGADMSLLSTISQDSAESAGRFLVDNETDGDDVPADFRPLADSYAERPASVDRPDARCRNLDQMPVWIAEIDTLAA